MSISDPPRMPDARGAAETRGAAGNCGWRAAWRLARRELRGGLRGLRIFLACLMVGVVAIVAVETTATGIETSLAREGRTILGGELSLSVVGRTASPAQLAFLEGFGTVDHAVKLTSMAQPAGLADGEGPPAMLVEVKAVAESYPLFGELVLVEGGALHATLAPRAGRPGAVVDPSVAARLDLARGDRLRLGGAEFTLRGIIAREPDRLGGGFQWGPRVMISQAALAETALAGQGTLAEHFYRLRLDPGRKAAALARGFRERFDTAGWRLRDYREAAPTLERFVDRLALFLSLVGLTALLVGGVGVANAVRAYLDGKTATIATLKCLGAPSALIFRTYLLQVMSLAGLGVAAGIALGILAPMLAAGPLSAALGVEIAIGPSPRAIGLGLAFGLVGAAAFSLWALGRAAHMAPAALFRARGQGAGLVPSRRVRVAVFLAGAGLAALAVLTSRDPDFAAIFVGFSLLCVLLFAAGAETLLLLGRKLPRPRRPGPRLALANLVRPGAPTGSLMLSIGLGLTALVAIALIDGNFTRQITRSLPAQSPAFFFLDIPAERADAFRDFVAGIEGAGALDMQPMLRGRIERVNGTPGAQALVNEREAWVLDGDRRLTFMAAPPADMEMIAGRWWAPDYEGPPAISVADDVAEAFGVGVGDVITFAILGREITAEIMSVRQVSWDAIELRFAVIFAPGTLEAANPGRIATLAADSKAEAALLRALPGRFPGVTAVPVRAALATVNRILGRIALSVRVVAGVTLLAGALVLAGALAAEHRRRLHDAVILKVLGGTRVAVMRAFLMEYGALGLLSAALAAVLGTAGAWWLVTEPMNLDWVFLPGAVGVTLLLALAVTLGPGLVASWLPRTQPAAPLPRNE